MKFKTSRAFAAVVFAAICATVLFASAPRAVGQEDITGHKLYFGVKPLPSADMKAFQQAPAAGLKMWSYKATSTRVGSKGSRFHWRDGGQQPDHHKWNNRDHRLRRSADFQDWGPDF